MLIFLSIRRLNTVDFSLAGNYADWYNIDD